MASVCVSAEPRLHAVVNEANMLYPVVSSFRLLPEITGFQFLKSGWSRI